METNRDVVLFILHYAAADPGFPRGWAPITGGGAYLLLPPATKLWQGNVFRSVCQEFCPGGACMAGRQEMHGGGGMHGRLCAWWGHAWQWGVCGRGGMHGRGACMSVCVAEGHAWQGTCVAVGEHAWQGSVCGRGDVRGRRNGHWSGWYASYWNAFLFGKFFFENCMEMKKNWTKRRRAVTSFRSATPTYNSD